LLTTLFTGIRGKEIYKIEQVNSILSEFSNCQLHLSLGGDEIELGEINQPATIYRGVTTAPLLLASKWKCSAVLLLIITKHYPQFNIYDLRSALAMPECDVAGYFEGSKACVMS